MNTLINSKTAKYTLAVGTILIASTTVAAVFTTMHAPKQFTPVTPTDSFVLDDSAEASTTVNQLEWARCLVGQTFTDGKCTGDATEFTTWESALAAPTPQQAAEGWRVPNIKELVRITETTQSFPAINTEVFPFGLKMTFNQTKNERGGGWHWSSSNSPFIWSATPVKVTTVTMEGSNKLTPKESVIATEKARADAEQVYALEFGLGKPEIVYRDGDSNGKHEAASYSNNDPDNVEKARYVLLVKDIPKA